MKPSTLADWPARSRPIRTRLSLTLGPGRRCCHIAAAAAQSVGTESANHSRCRRASSASRLTLGRPVVVVHTARIFSHVASSALPFVLEARPFELFVVVVIFSLLIFKFCFLFLRAPESSIAARRQQKQHITRALAFFACDIHF